MEFADLPIMNLYLLDQTKLLIYVIILNVLHKLKHSDSPMTNGKINEFSRYSDCFEFPKPDNILLNILSFQFLKMQNMKV